MNYESMSKKGKIWLWISSIALFLITTGLVWWANHLYAFQADDDWYETLLYSDEKIKNLLDIFKAQKWHYMNWGGRSITHTMVQLTLLAGEPVADILNTVMTVLTGVIITGMTETMTLIKRSIPGRLLSVTVVMGLITGLNADISQSMFWQSGACNYLYITVFILLFLWVYIREIPYDCFGSKEPLWGVDVWIIPLAIIAGWSNENMGPVVFLFAVATTIYVRKVGHNVEPWMAEGAVFSFLGSAACILAPGNFVRSEEISYNNGILWQIGYRIYQTLISPFYMLVLVMLVAFAVVMIAKAECNFKLGLEAIYLLTGALLSFLAMFLSPHYPSRATYGTMVLLIVVIVALSQRIFEKKPALTKWFYIAAGFIWLRGMFFTAEFVASGLGLI